MNNKKIIASYEVWDILNDLAAKGETIYYKELGDRIGYNAQSVGTVLSLLQNFCIWKEIPPITVLVVNQETGLPGDGYQIRFGNVDTDFKETFKYPWSNSSTEYTYKYDPKYE